MLRPGGLGLTRQLIEHAQIPGADVVELAPGLGRTAVEIIAMDPSSYVGVEKEEVAAKLTASAVGQAGSVVTADAADTGLPDASADVVIGEAMLTMQSDTAKRAIVTEAVRVLRPGGRYAIHELGLHPDDLDPELKADLRRDLARVIKVNARPQTVAEWRALLEESGLVVEWVGTAPMALLQMRRNLTDEGIRGTARMIRNAAREADARRRVLAMRALFRRHQDTLRGVALVAGDPGSRPAEARSRRRVGAADLPGPVRRRYADWRLVHAVIGRVISHAKGTHLTSTLARSLVNTLPAGAEVVIVGDQEIATAAAVLADTGAE